MKKPKIIQFLKVDLILLLRQLLKINFEKTNWSLNNHNILELNLKINNSVRLILQMMRDHTNQIYNIANQPKSNTIYEMLAPNTSGHIG